MRSWGSIRRLVRYGVVGLASATAHLGTTLLLVESGVTRPIIATNIGFALSVVVSYLLQRAWVFRSNRPHLQAFPRFLSVVAASAALNAAIVGVGHEILRVDYRLAQLVALVLIPIVNFTGNRLWTFREPATTSDARWSTGGREDVRDPDPHPRS
jgi:putative flippase GtrA